jgi:hypothetical protein
MATIPHCSIIYLFLGKGGGVDAEECPRLELQHIHINTEILRAITHCSITYLFHGKGSGGRLGRVFKAGIVAYLNNS